MSSKTILIIIGGFVGGVAAISFMMLAGSGWETPGTYTGINNAAHVPSSTTHCYSFQTGCKNIETKIPQSEMDSGAYLSGNFKR